jgi:hypothetical protein
VSVAVTIVPLRITVSNRMVRSPPHNFHEGL